MPEPEPESLTAALNECHLPLTLTPTLTPTPTLTLTLTLTAVLNECHLPFPPNTACSTQVVVRDGAFARATSNLLGRLALIRLKTRHAIDRDVLCLKAAVAVARVHYPGQVGLAILAQRRWDEVDV